MTDLFLKNLWPSLVLWGVIYISDYVLTVTCARLYRDGVNTHIVFEGSYELNPVFQKDIDSLRWVSRRFLVALVFSEVWLAWCWVLAGQSQPVFYELMLGIVVLVELMIHIRHLRNLFLFRAIRKSRAVVGRIEYPRVLLLKMSFFECVVFSGVYLFLFAFTTNWFIFGGVIGCLSLAGKHFVLARKYRTIESLAVQTSRQ